MKDASPQVTRDSAILAAARALSDWIDPDDPISYDGMLPEEQAEAREAIEVVFNAINWRPESVVKAEALREYADTWADDNSTHRWVKRHLNDAANRIEKG